MIRPECFDERIGEGHRLAAYGLLVNSGGAFHMDRQTSAPVSGSLTYENADVRTHGSIAHRPSLRYAPSSSRSKVWI